MKYKSKISLLLLIVILFSTFSACASKVGYQEINFNFDTYDVPLENKCLLIDNTTMIPMREIFSYMNMQISWNDETSTATAQNSENKLEVTKDSNILKFNGTDIPMPVKCVTIDGRMYIPLRALAEMMGYEVDYSDKYNTAYVFSSEREILPATEVQVTSSVLNENDKIWLKTTLDDSLKKVAKTVGRTKGNVCYSTQSGLYTNKGAEKTNWWTNGFYPGILWIMYENTGDQRYADYAQILEDNLAEGLLQKETLDHDVGFLWMLSGYRNYQLKQNEESKTRVLTAAQSLYDRYNRNGKFIVSWNGKGNENKSIIDNMMNLDILYTASNLTRNPAYAKAASNHADTVIKNFIRDDGSCHHQVIMNPENGEKVSVVAGQGYEDVKGEGSHWARGNAWALYGFAKCFNFTGDIKYAQASEKIASYFKSNLRNGYDVPMDFNQPGYVNLVDTSAAAIAASGYIDLAKITKNEEYLTTALNLLKNITTKYGGDNGEEALLTNGCVTYSNPTQQTLIYADYYYLEALMKLKDFSY